MLGILCVLAAVGLLVASFVSPPPGQIHNSAFIGAGELLLFGGIFMYVTTRGAGDDD